MIFEKWFGLSFPQTFLPNFDKARNKKAQMIRDGSPVFTYHGKDNSKKKPIAGTYLSIFPALIRTFGPKFFFGSALKVSYADANSDRCFL